MEVKTTPLIIGVPTPNGMGLTVSILTLSELYRSLDRSVVFAQGEAGNIPRARNQVLVMIRAQLGLDSVPVLWWDTDILINKDQITPIVDMIHYGETHQVCVTANYRMNTGDSHLMRGDRTPGAGTHYTAEELATMPDWSPVGMAGFGLLFIPQMPLDYVFHADTVGEDVHWWWDHADLPLVLSKSVQIRHRKSVWL